MTPSTVHLRNDALRALANHCRLTTAEASSLRVDSYRRTKKGRQPYLSLPPNGVEGFIAAYSFLPAPIVRRLDRYLARRERVTGIRPHGAMPLFLTDCSISVPRRMTPLEVGEVLGLARKRA